MGRQEGLKQRRGPESPDPGRGLYSLPSILGYYTVVSFNTNRLTHTYIHTYTCELDANPSRDELRPKSSWDSHFGQSPDGVALVYCLVHRVDPGRCCTCAVCMCECVLQLQRNTIISSSSRIKDNGTGIKFCRIMKGRLG